jgi:hypothetical protein
MTRPQLNRCAVGFYSILSRCLPSFPLSHYCVSPYLPDRSRPFGNDRAQHEQEDCPGCPQAPYARRPAAAGAHPQDPTAFHRGCKASLATPPAKGYTGFSLPTSCRVTRLLDHDLPEYEGTQHEGCGGNTTKASGDGEGIAAAAVLQVHAGGDSATSHHAPRMRFPAAAREKSLRTVGTNEAEIMPPKRATNCWKLQTRTARLLYIHRRSSSIRRKSSGGSKRGWPNEAGSVLVPLRATALPMPPSLKRLSGLSEVGLDGD